MHTSMRRSNDEGRYRIAETISKSSEPTRVRTSTTFSLLVRAWFGGSSAGVDDPRHTDWSDERLVRPSVGSGNSAIVRPHAALECPRVRVSCSVGEPYCEDFNEQSTCGQDSNVNACATPPGNFTNFPTFNTTCG